MAFIRLIYVLCFISVLANSTLALSFQELKMKYSLCCELDDECSDNEGLPDNEFKPIDEKLNIIISLTLPTVLLLSSIDSCKRLFTLQLPYKNFIRTQTTPPPELWFSIL